MARLSIGLRWLGKVSLILASFVILSTVGLALLVFCACLMAGAEAGP